jgi:hypothetical protein
MVEVIEEAVQVIISAANPSSQRVVRNLRRTTLQPVMYRQNSTFVRSERMHRRSRSIARIKFHLVVLHPESIRPVA